VSFGQGAARLLFPLTERLEGRRIRPKLARLRAEAGDTPERRRQRQRERLAAVCRHAGAHVPHYRELFARCRFEPGRLIHEPEALAALPPLDRDTLIEVGPRLLDERLDRGALHPRRTGGSTGRSARIYYSQEALDWTAAANLWVRERAGKAPFRAEVHLSTALEIDVPWRDRVRERVKCAALNRTNLPIASWDAHTLDALHRDLARARPCLVQSHPSTMHRLARHVWEGGGLAAPLFAIFESTGETLDPDARKTIEDVLGCTVVDRYGSAEFGVVACERPGGRPGMAILDGLVAAETLPAADGREELVLTGLRNPAMPLIRYRTGDLAKLACEPEEAAGRIVAIHGRIHDAVPIGGQCVPSHVIQDRLDRLGCIDEFQVEVSSDRRPRLRVAAPQADHGRIRRGVHAWWGDELELEFTSGDRFVRSGWRGKFRHVVGPEGRP